MGTLAAERKALLFSVGEVRLALRLSQVREIVALDGARDGAAAPAIPVAVALGVSGGPSRYAIVTEAGPAAALHVAALHGILDLGRAEVFQLPARTLLPQPPPFQGAIAGDGELALELVVGALGWAPIEPAADPDEPPPGLEGPSARELLFCRAGRTFAVPLALLVHVLDAPRIHPVPLAPPSHLGLAYHGRAIHPVLDPAVLHGDAPGAPGAATVLLVDAGGAQVGLAADHVLQPGAAAEAAVLRPSWDALFAG
jgi:chemotaxis signal transduction protein